MIEAVHIVDIDGTLFSTDKLNTLSYNYALKKYGIEPILNHTRVTREVVMKERPQICQQLLEQIINDKQDYFCNHVDLTTINQKLFLRSTRDPDGIGIIWTSADSKRTKALLEYYRADYAYSEVYTNIDKSPGKLRSSLIAFGHKRGGSRFYRYIFYENDAALRKRLKDTGLIKTQIQSDDFE